MLCCGPWTPGRRRQCPLASGQSWSGARPGVESPALPQPAPRPLPTVCLPQKRLWGVRHLLQVFRRQRHSSFLLLLLLVCHHRGRVHRRKLRQSSAIRCNFAGRHWGSSSPTTRRVSACAASTTGTRSGSSPSSRSSSSSSPSSSSPLAVSRGRCRHVGKHLVQRCDVGRREGLRRGGVFGGTERQSVGGGAVTISLHTSFAHRQKTHKRHFRRLHPSLNRRTAASKNFCFSVSSVLLARRFTPSTLGTQENTDCKTNKKPCQQYVRITGKHTYHAREQRQGRIHSDLPLGGFLSAVTPIKHGSHPVVVASILTMSAKGSVAAAGGARPAVGTKRGELQKDKAKEDDVRTANIIAGTESRQTAASAPPPAVVGSVPFGADSGRCRHFPVFKTVPL